MLHPPFLLGMIIGGAVIYWFTGASTQAVATGAYRAVEFIKANIKLEAPTRPRSRTRRRWSRSARSTRRRACSTSS
jgi:Na+/H+-translocating membrane pyrophosphatase